MKKKRRFYRDRRGRFISKKAYQARRRVRRVKGEKAKKKAIRKKIRKVSPRRLPKRRPRLDRRIRRQVRAHPRIIRRKRITVPLGWITRDAWLKSLQSRYGKLDRSRSDPPASRLRWFLQENRFLWHHRKYPPMGRYTSYIVLENWYVVYDETADAFYLWVQRRMLGAGESLDWIEEHLPAIIKEQKEKLNVHSYIEVRAHAAWSVYPLAEWDKARRLKERMKKRGK